MDCTPILALVNQSELYEIFPAFAISFITIFVALDPVGLLPVYISLTDGLERHEKARVIRHACVTGFLVAFSFMLGGNWIFKVLGIEMNDFVVAGGVILFCFSIFDLVNSNRRSEIKPDGEVGSVPLGVPIMVGPGTLAASVLLMAQYKQYGIFAMLIVSEAILLVLIIAAVVFSMGDKIVKIIRPAGARVVSRIASLILAAYAVMMIRVGILAMIEAASKTKAGN